jgi:two-component system CheB/CheR fusion protein
VKRKQPAKQTVPAAKQIPDLEVGAAEPIENENGRPTEGHAVVAIGASAGGLEAFTELIRDVPQDTGMAFVLVQHLDPKQSSMLAELVARETKMPVTQVQDTEPIRPNTVYVIPPNKFMYVESQRLRLAPRAESRAGHMTVDYFMRSLAEEYGGRSIGVILSGTDSDGTLGMREIQAQGGVTFAQDETTAKYEGMPRSAVSAGVVDFVLPPKGIALELARISKHPFSAHVQSSDGAELVPQEHSGLSSVFQLLRKNTGLDFTYYRHTTIRRRIQRRMLVHKIERLEDYVKYLQQHPAEVSALSQDMLINVTSFFRNPKVFEAMKVTAFPAILKRHPADTPIRIWAPGCASGEETYSLAIALLEFLGDRAAHLPMQLFGTDISEASIAKARTGIYPDNIQVDVSPERLRRYFMKLEGGYRISKTIRDMCIFAQHNVLSDPPFSQMDLICCRNLLIYLEPVLQKRVITVFHYALRHEGFLVLGSTEGITSSTSLFSLEDRANKIYVKKATGNRPQVTFGMTKPLGHVEPGDSRRDTPRTSELSWNYVEAQKEFDRRLLSQYAPAAVFINSDGEVIHSRGPVDRYLKLAPGRASLSVLKMVREGLLFELRNAINRAVKEKAPIRKRGIQIKDNGATREINLEVAPIVLPNLKETFSMVLFEETRPDGKSSGSGFKKKSKAEEPARNLIKLEQELAANKEYLQSVIETQEATNEELQSANEEILSSNEELQSTNEELETAKEELQSANEELTTVNEELRNRNLEMTQVNNDLTNLLSSINIGMVMLSSDLTIRRITPQAQRTLGVIPSDIGRPFTNINPSIEVPDMQSAILDVIDKLVTFERTVKDKAGNEYLLRILPYRTSENKIDGVVITVLESPKESESERARN